MTSPLPPVALASRSPRRRELLATHGLEHTIVDADVDDGDLEPGLTDARAWVMGLAYLKAAAGHAHAGSNLEQGWYVLGADTVCVQDGAIIGQPRDADHARSIIEQFRGQTHEVLTGVALIDAKTGKRAIFLDVALVTVGWIDDASINAYVSTGAWRGKAGAYNLAERVSADWPITYSGDPEGIMGLPMKALLSRLRALSAGGDRLENRTE